MKWTLCLAARLKNSMADCLHSHQCGWVRKPAKSEVKAVIRQATISKDEMGRVTG